MTGDRYPDMPGFKARDTSKAAALKVAEKAPTVRALVLRTIANAGQFGLTADEAAARIGRDILTVRPRLSELVNLDQIHDSGHRRRNRSGHKAVVWRIGRDPNKPVPLVQPDKPVPNEAEMEAMYFMLEGMPKARQKASVMMCRRPELGWISDEQAERLIDSLGLRSA